MTADDVLLKAISARVLVAIEYNRRGEPESVNDALEQLRKVLPAPDEHNIEAAFATIGGAK